MSRQAARDRLRHAISGVTGFMQQVWTRHVVCERAVVGVARQFQAGPSSPPPLPLHSCSYYALEGGAGEERWHHTSGDFHRDLTDLASELQPQNNYK